MGFSLSDLDPTYSKGWLGKNIGPGGVEVVREGIGIGLVSTGGIGLLFPKTRRWALRGGMTAAHIGVAGADGDLAGAAMAGAKQVSVNITPTGTGAFAGPGQGAGSGGAPDLSQLLAGFTRSPVFWVLAAIAVLFLVGGRRSK